jgi:ABC-type transport system substrate-binding protein
MPIIKEPSTIFASLRSGQLDSTARSLSPELVKDFQASPDLRVQRGPGFASSLLLFNNERAPWDKREVRQAVAAALDAKNLVDTVLLGYGTASPLDPPGSPYHEPGRGGPDLVAPGHCSMAWATRTRMATDPRGGRQEDEAALLVYANDAVASGRPSHRAALRRSASSR